MLDFIKTLKELLGVKFTEIAPQLHFHTEHSLKDCGIKVKNAFSIAKAKGIPAIAITDHGTITSVAEARKFAKEYGVKYIPGVEAYYQDANDTLAKRRHLILLAKDFQGYKAISLAITASNANIDSKGFPIMNEEILNKYFAEGTIGHDHVIATSACAGGVIASILNMNESVTKEIGKIQGKLSGLYDPESPVYQTALAEKNRIEGELEKLAVEIKDTEKLAKKPFTAKERALKAFEGKPEYADKKDALEREKAESEEAKKKVVELKDMRTALKTELQTVNTTVKMFEGSNLVRYNAFKETLVKLNNSLLSSDELYVKAKAEAEKFRNIFGADNFYCEIQFHHIDVEKLVMPQIVSIARELSIPLVAANDIHILDNSIESIKARQLVRSLRFNTWEELNQGDDELYIKTNAEISKIFSEIFTEDVISESIKNIYEIADTCNVEFVDEPHYPKFVSDDGEDAIARLRRLATEGITWRFPDHTKWTKEYEERMEYELDIITKLGFCDYLCIVEDFLTYGRLLGKIDLNDERYLADPYNFTLLRELAKDEVGLGIGPGRGSAVGSLVCYLIGITGIDPMKYNLLFERFLNTERVSMPDIDSDFKRDIRNKVLDYVKFKYGEEAVCCIMTKGTRAVKGSIRDAARLLGSEKADDTTKYLSLGDAISKKVPSKPDISFDDVEDNLVKEFSDNKNALKIIENAKLLSGVFANVGMHAAGVIIADNGDVKQYVPLMWNSEKEQWLTQIEKDYCESIGLLKMDFLGLRNLDIITEALKMIQKNKGISIDIENVPLDPKVFAKIFATGKTNSVFQFESGGMKQMLRQFQPTCLEDIILLNAAYRPGPMQYLEDIIAVKHGRKKPTYVIPEMEEVLGTTYGCPVYQEQIMQIFNKFAGFSLGQADIIRRLMSKKKVSEFQKYKDKFVEGLIKKGANKENAESFWNELEKFSLYAFNKSHATAYAIVAYYTAWLKYYYPTEFFAAVFNSTEFDKLGTLISECKDFGVSVIPADINKCGVRYVPNAEKVFVGLSSIKGVANSANTIILERKNGCFNSFIDFLLRAKVSKDVVENLVYAGAFDEFTKNRQALINALPDYQEILKKIKTKETTISSLENATTDADISKREKAIEARDILVKSLHSVSVNVDSEEDIVLRLEKEKEVVGTFVSGHPLDSYGKPEDFKCTPIVDVDVQKNISIMGMIKDLKITARKSDGKAMAFFNIEDRTGEIKVNCFTYAYSKNKDFIVEDAVVIVDGDIVQDEDIFSDELVYKLNLQTIKPVKKKKKYVCIKMKDITEWETIKEMIKPYRVKEETGFSLVVYDEMYGKYRKTIYWVSPEIVSLKSLSPIFP